LWIIFDLDDTLIDTFYSIIPHRLEAIWLLMIARGLEVEDPQQEKEIFFSYHEQSSSSEETIVKFLHGKKNRDFFFEIAMKELQSIEGLNNIVVKPLEHVLDTLSLLKSHKLFIVTKGKPELQLKKLEKSGIDKALFSNIFTAEAKGKMCIYKEILQKEQIPPSCMVVIGDRVQADLLPAVRLGCWAVHMKWGRGKMLTTPSEVPFAISRWPEIHEILTIIEERRRSGADK
jgi:HAD superfamily hydrolase (TIGR01549 family)